MLMASRPNGSADTVPPCDVQGHQSFRRPLQAAGLQCLRRAYPEEAATMRTKSSYISDWWSKSSLCVAGGA